MKTSLLVAVVCAGLPGCAVQDPVAPSSPDSAVFAAGCKVDDEADEHAHRNQERRQRAASALPARASTRPAPQLGTVAPATRVPSHAVTPSLRAMERATAEREAQETGAVKKNSPSCAPPLAPDRAPSGGLRRG